MGGCETKYKDNDIESKNVPLEFVCPLTRKIMNKPVVIETGRAFEEEAILKFFGRGKFIDPISGQRLATNKTVRVNALKSLIKKSWGT